MKFKPLPRQISMIDHLVNNENAALFCFPGAGKTVVTLKALDDLATIGKAHGALICSPTRCCSITWPDQVRQWEHSNWMRIAHLRTEAGMQAWHDRSADIYLINPEMLPSRIPLMFPKKSSPAPVDTIVIDELSLAKNPQSKRFKALRPHLKKFKRRIGLTGTPVPNDYLDLYGQIRLMDDGKRLGGSMSAYRNEWFYQADYMGYDWKLRKGGKQEIDGALSDLCLVQLGDDADLPASSIVDVPVTLPPAARKAYTTLEKELLLNISNCDSMRERGREITNRMDIIWAKIANDLMAMDSPFIEECEYIALKEKTAPLSKEYESLRKERMALEIIAPAAATLAGKLLQLTSGAVYDEDRNVLHVHTAKLDALVKLRKQHGNEPMLVLCAFKHESARVLDALPCARMFNELDMDEWQAGRIRTWVADARSLSHGIDGIQKSCRIAVWVSLTYSQETYQQTNARIIRHGQANETLIYRIIAPGTIDDAVAEALRVKSDTQTGLMHALHALQQLRS